MTLGNDNRTDGQTDRRTDRVRRNMRPPPREEGRIIKDTDTQSTQKVSLLRKVSLHNTFTCSSLSRTAR